MSIEEPIHDRDKIREEIEEDSAPEPKTYACGGVIHGPRPARYYDERMLDIILDSSYLARLAYRQDPEFKITLDALVNGIRRTVDGMARAAADRQAEHQRMLRKILIDVPQLRPEAFRIPYGVIPPLDATSITSISEV